MSRLQRAHSPQGEFSRADHNPLAAQGTLTGTKLSQHTACMAATGTKLSPHTAYMATTGTKLSGQSPPQGQPVQNSPSTAKNAHFSPSSASRENFFPVQTQTTRAGRIFSRRPPPTSHAAHTHGTKLSQHPPPQGQTGTKLSGQSPPQGQPVQNSPSTRRVRPQPVQNSPSTGKTAHFSPSSASREKIVTVQTQTTRAGRIFSRRPPLTSHAAHTHGTKFSPQPPPQGRNRYKTLRAIPASRPTGTKLSPHSPTRTRTLKVACNSITARIRAYSKALESQGSVITARRTHWGIACETAEAPERRRTKRGR